MAEDRAPRTVIDLLWKGIAQPRRGPRHRLTVGAVVETSMALAEEEGLDALSMRKVARRLGVGAATLYTYVPDRSALLALMVDTMVSQAPLPHTRPGTWREKVEAWCRDDVRSYRAHPWLVDLVALHLPTGPHAFTWTDSALRVFEGTGLSAREALSVIEAVEGYVQGHVVNMVRADRGEQLEGESIQALQRAMVEDPERFPTVRALTSGPEAGEVFEEGLTWLLDGIERRIIAQHRPEIGEKSATPKESTP